MNRIREFKPTHPSGTAPGAETVRLDLLQAAVANTAPEAKPEPLQVMPLVAKNLRLPADLVDYIDFVFTKEQRMKKQDAYALALEAYFRPLMAETK